MCEVCYRQYIDRFWVLCARLIYWKYTARQGQVTRLWLKCCKSCTNGGLCLPNAVNSVQMGGCASQNAANSVQMRGLGGRVGRPFLELKNVEPVVGKWGVPWYRNPLVHHIPLKKSFLWGAHWHTKHSERHQEPHMFDGEGGNPVRKQRRRPNPRRRRRIRCLGYSWGQTWVTGWWFGTWILFSIYWE